jgi:hypothetical protein
MQRIDLATGLNHLKNAFLFMLIGVALSWIPFINFVAVVLLLVSFIFIVLGWRGLGKSNLGHAPSYGSTALVLIVIFIAEIAIVVGGIVAAILLILPSIITAATTTPSPPPSFATLPIWSEFVSLLFAVVIVAVWIAFAGWVKNGLSLKSLSNELSQPQLRTCGNLYIVYSAIGAISATSFGLLLALGVTLFPTTTTGGQIGNLSPFFVFSSFPEGILFALVGILGLILLIVASVLGYTGTSDAVRNLGSSYYGWTFPPPPGQPYPVPPVRPPTYERQRAGINYCPRCNYNLSNSTANFCPNCGMKLKDNV